MARGLNKVTLIGALAREPELRYTPSGTPVFEATVAGEDHITGMDGRERKLPWYHRVTVIGKPAEWHAERFKAAGQVVSVSGSVEYSQWDAPEGGKRSMVRVKAAQMEAHDLAHDLINDAGGGVRLSGGINRIELIGNVARDAELRYTPAGDAVLGLGLAVNEVWTDRQGQRQEKTHWIDLTLWRDLAERCREIRKGQPVHVFGRIVNEAWTDRDGNKRNTTKVEVSDIWWLERGPAQGAQGGASASTRPSSPPARPSAAARPSGPRGGGSAEQAAYANRSGGLDIDQGLDDFPPDDEDLPF